MQIIATEFILGVLSQLNSVNLVFLNTVLSAGVLLWLHRKFGRRISQKYLSSIAQMPKQIWVETKKDPLWLILLVISLLFAVWIIFIGLIFPVIDWDGNSYHMTFIGNVMQNQHFLDVPTSRTWLTGYPKGGEFMQMWSVIITKNDFAADLAQMPFLVLGIYSLYQIGVALGASKRNARFCALLFLFLPTVANQLKTTYVDVMLSSLFFASLAMLIRKKLTTLDFVLVGVIFSLLISIKPTGLLFVAVVLPLLFWNLHKNKVGQKWVSNYVKPLLVIAGPTAFGLYWYVKNLVEYDTPIYPFGVKVFGKSIFPGQTFQEFAANAVQSTSLPDGYLHRIWFVWTEQNDWFGCLYNYDTNYAGLGPIWFVLLLPATIAAAYIAFKKKMVLFGAIYAATLVLFAIYPSNYYPRYTMFVAVVGIVGLAIVLTYTRRSTSTFTKVMGILFALFVVSTTFTMCNFAPLTIKDQMKSLASGSERGEIYRANLGKAYVFIEDRLLPGDVIVYDSNPWFIYPLWKSDFSNKVLYIPAENELAWFESLSKQNAKYVFTTRGSKENGWSEGKIDKIYEDDLYAIYQAN